MKPSFSTRPAESPKKALALLAATELANMVTKLWKKKTKKITPNAAHMEEVTKGIEKDTAVYKVTFFQVISIRITLVFRQEDWRIWGADLEFFPDPDHIVDGEQKMIILTDEFFSSKRWWDQKLPEVD